MTPARQPHPQRCHICGAEMSHENPEICKNFHVQQATHTSTPAPIVKEVRDNLCVICQDSLKAHDAQVAKAAREQVLNVRPEVRKFAELMEAKLKKNDHKSHWSRESFTYLFGRLDDEMKELNQAVSSAKTDHERIADEAVDVANFLMMIVDNLQSLRAQQQEQP